MLRSSGTSEWSSFALSGSSARTHYLLPGDVVVCTEPTVVSTVLGSCVSVCLFDRRLKTGGMNHFVLPRSGTDRTPSARFAPFAMQSLLDRMIRFGSRPVDILAHLIGGACVLKSVTPGPNHLGMQNVRAAQGFLSEKRIQVVREDAGGQRGRHLRFHTDTGDAFIRQF